MLHQGRLAPDNLMMQMQVREMKWLPSGWPVISPKRYAGHEQRSIGEKELEGLWEVIHLSSLADQTELWQGQIPPGGWTYSKTAFNVSERVNLNKRGDIEGGGFNKWEVEGDFLKIDDSVCAMFSAWDWENQRETILFSGILADETSVWGKKNE